jgi:hypothetical protein
MSSKVQQFPLDRSRSTLHDIGKGECEMDEVFKDPRRSARAASIALIIFVVTDILFTAGELYTIAAIDRFRAGSATLSDLEMSDSIRGITAGINLLVMLISGIFVCRWIYGVNRNAQIFGQDWMTVSPGWNVGYLFIPFAGWFMPFRGLRETFQVSTDPGSPGAVPLPGLMRLWWGAWIIMTALGNISGRLSLRAETLEDIRFSSLISAVSIFADLVAVASLIWLIRTLTKNQVQNFSTEIGVASGTVSVFT